MNAPHLAARVGIAVTILGVAVAVLVWAPWASSERVSKWEPTVRALCDATTSVERGQLPAARVAFHNGVHAPLHRLAADVAERDRSVAAGLLEAKEEVETVIDASQKTDLSTKLRRLAAQTRSAARILDEPVRVSCGAGQ